MTTFRAVVFEHHQKQDGTYNVKIRVTHNGCKRYIATNHYVRKDQMTRGLKIKDARVVSLLEETIAQMRLEVSKLGIVADSMSVQELVDIISENVKKGDYFTLNFVKYWREKIKGMKKGTAQVYMTALNAVLRFTKGKEIDISVITSQWLREFVQFIDREPAPGGRAKTGGRARSLYPACIRHIYNLAREEFNDESKDYFPLQYNPFTRFSVPKTPRSREKALSISVIQRIIDYKIDRDNCGVRRGEFYPEELARDMFLLSFGLIGMNAADIYEMKKVRNGIVDYERKKTRDRRDDRARMKVRVEPEIRKLLEKYRNHENDVLELVFADHYSDPTSMANTINIGLARIADAIGVERFTFYAARHSWATIAYNVARIDKWLIHSAINHTDKTMSITDIYIAKDYSLFWDANRKVLSLFRWDSVL